MLQSEPPLRKVAARHIPFIPQEVPVPIRQPYRDRIFFENESGNRTGAAGAEKGHTGRPASQKSRKHAKAVHCSIYLPFRPSIAKYWSKSCFLHTIWRIYRTDYIYLCKNQSIQCIREVVWRHTDTLLRWCKSEVIERKLFFVKSM